jgi:hypothetical protein
MTLTPSAPTRTPIDKKKDWASGVTPYAEMVIIMMD